MASQTHWVCDIEKVDVFKHWDTGTHHAAAGMLHCLLARLLSACGIANAHDRVMMLEVYSAITLHACMVVNKIAMYMVLL